MIGMRAFRAIGAVAAVGGALLIAPPAMAAGPYGIDASITAPSGVLSYLPSSFQWAANDPFEVTFTHTTDTTTGTLHGFVQSHTNLSGAVVHETLNGKATVTLQMSNVRVDLVREGGNVNNANGPEETVVLHFRSVTYTFQPLSPTGLPAGAPVVVTYTRP
jgi:hypothetical protein